MADIVLGCDINTNDQEYQSTVAQILEQAGHKVQKLAIEPNAYATASYDSSSKGKIGIYLIAAGTYSIGDAYEGGTYFDYNYFGIRPEASPSWEASDFDTKPIGSDPDTKGGVTDKIAGKSFKEINEIVKDKCMCVTGKDATEMGNNLVNAISGKGFSTGSSSTEGETAGGGSAVLIPDKTFYGVIKQILGVIDGVFIIANNMAYLLSFSDLYKYREQFEDYIPELKMSDIVVDTVIKNWTTEGFYNAVEVTYSGGIIRYQHDVLVETYGENTFYYEFPNDDEETAISKAQALLSAHVRDYSLDLQFDCIYNPNITVGSWLKVPKTLTQTPKSKTSKGFDKSKRAKTRKGANILNINAISQEDQIIEHITTDDGEYDVQVEKKDYEMYFVQGYKLKWTPKQVPLMHLHLKYGPDTPEDPVNATIGIGGIQSNTSTGTGSVGGQYGDDCFGVEIAQLEGDYRIPHSGVGGVEYATQNPPSAEMTAGRCKQGSAYDKEVAGKTPQEAYYIASSKFVYCYYADNCHLYKCNEERWLSGECGFNCGDSATILKSVLDCVGQKNWIFHIENHYHTMIDDNGILKTVDLSRRSDEVTHSVGWPAANTGQCGCPCHL